MQFLHSILLSISLFFHPVPHSPLIEIVRANQVIEQAKTVSAVVAPTPEKAPPKPAPKVVKAVIHKVPKAGGILVGASTALPVSETSYFAQIDANNIVINVIVATSGFIASGIKGTPAKWIQASDKATIRGVYPGVGYNYDPIKDIFYYPQPFPSWTLNATTDTWTPPVVRPQGNFVWNEKLLNWVVPTI